MGTSKVSKKLVLIIFFLFNNIGLGLAHNLPISSNFGWRTHPISGEWKFHSGLDLAYEEGTKIPALFNGIVVFASENGGYGNMIYLYHPTENVYTAYAHCASLIAQEGQQVSAGSIIAYVGSSGYSTGPHLHIEYIIKDAEGNWQYSDPLKLWQ